MYCENCGNKLDTSHRFCTSCGHTAETTKTSSKQKTNHKEVLSGERWWHRLLKVAYLFIYLQVLWIVPTVWSVNSSGYNIYSRRYEDTYGEAFWYALLALVICVVIIRLVKITTLYVAFGISPKWREEFRKLF
ncbi:hypothetical protein BK005_01930 [bacterium CG10_37_50]|uniref:Zinc-ribbon domain-containing protein n=1 Tax=Candidatus Campbellbacteria bacterium CG22_combo_CG10-13_8_21_14_all_36_13 TaxID=1974529 RepID=A0A2H0DZ61_9BACT|nr:MAG: hypothetical protein BK005_01930 [bacterium CG10_37_50]PIP87462.1 MAG: hypothetical protein COW81_00095 [Candidatus Campbellbacteria bacterium CG22_combo_CG10-13_8_21_14_all_36_13]